MGDNSDDDNLSEEELARLQFNKTYANNENIMLRNKGAKNRLQNAIDELEEFCWLRSHNPSETNIEYVNAASELKYELEVLLADFENRMSGDIESDADLPEEVTDAADRYLYDYVDE